MQGDRDQKMNERHTVEEAEMFPDCVTTFTVPVADLPLDSKYPSCLNVDLKDRSPWQRLLSYYLQQSTIFSVLQVPNSI